MTDFHSDYETIKALQKLTELIQQGLENAWDPEIVKEAKQEIESTLSKSMQKVEFIEVDIQQIETKLKAVNLQKAELEKTIEVANRLAQLIQDLGGTNKLQQNLAKLVHLNELLNEISNGRQVAESLQYQTQNLQETTTSLIKKIDHLGGTNTLIEKFNQVQEIAKKLDTVDFQIQSNINSCLNNYLPEFEAGKLQIEQWRNDVLLDTNKTLEKISDIYQSIDQSFNKLNQDYYNAEKIFQELDRKESELQLILNSISELTQSVGGENLVLNITKKLTNLENFIVSEKSDLNKFKKELKENFNKEFKEIIDQHKKVFMKEVADLNNFVISSRSQINVIQNQLKEYFRNEFDQMAKKTKNDLKIELSNEFQSLLSEEIKKLEVKYLQEIDRLAQENKNLKNSSFKLIWK